MVDSLKDILGDFNPAAPTGSEPMGYITIRVPRTDKKRYDKLQAGSGRQFSKKARLALCALMDLAESRAS